MIADRSTMQVALCTDGVYPQAMGGMQRHTRLLAEHLAARGHVQLTVLHPHRTPIFSPDAGIHEVHIPAIDTERFYLRELWRYSGRIAEALHRLSPDVILSQGFCVWKGMEAFSERLIVHPHGLEMFQGLSMKERLLGLPFRQSLRHIVRRSAVVVSLGGRLTGILEEVAAGSKCQVATIPNAVDVPPIPAPKPADEGPLRLLFVGRFAFNKGIDVLMAVARRLHDEGLGDAVRFLLAGDGPLLATYRAQGMPPNTELLGRVDDETLDRLYTECHAFVLPTRFEGMPTVVLEAMARARPIIVSDVGATAEQVDASNGFLLPPGDAQALYRAVRDLLACSPAEREAMGLASHTRALDHFSWPAATAQFETLFGRVAQ